MGVFCISTVAPSMLISAGSEPKELTRVREKVSPGFTSRVGPGKVQLDS